MIFGWFRKKKQSRNSQRIDRSEMRNILVDAIKCNPHNLKLEDNYYRLSTDGEIKEVLRDYTILPYHKEIQDCDDRARDLWHYLGKKGIASAIIKTPGDYKTPGHMQCLYVNTDKEVKVIEPGTKYICELPNDILWLVMF